MQRALLPSRFLCGVRTSLGSYKGTRGKEHLGGGVFPPFQALIINLSKLPASYLSPRLLAFPFRGRRPRHGAAASHPTRHQGEAAQSLEWP